MTPAPNTSCCECPAPNMQRSTYLGPNFKACECECHTAHQSSQSKGFAVTQYKDEPPVVISYDKGESWEKDIWRWATHEFPHQHADKFEKLIQVVSKLLSERKAKTLEEVVQVIHLYAMKTEDTKTLDLLEQIQRHILSFIAPHQTL